MAELRPRSSSCGGAELLYCGVDVKPFSRPYRFVFEAPVPITAWVMLKETRYHATGELLCGTAEKVAPLSIDWLHPDQSEPTTDPDASLVYAVTVDVTEPLDASQSEVVYTLGVGSPDGPIAPETPWRLTVLPLPKVRQNPF